MVIAVKDQNKMYTRPKDVCSLVQDMLAAEDEIDRDKEHVWVFHLNARNQIIVAELVGLGLINTCPVHPREVFTRAVGCRASGIIIAHNHPSGCTVPSGEDISITRKLVEAGNILDIPVFDHVIVGANAYYSLKEEGHIH